MSPYFWSGKSRRHHLLGPVLIFPFPHSSSCKARRKGWIKLIYSSSLLSPFWESISVWYSLSAGMPSSSSSSSLGILWLSCIKISTSSPPKSESLSAYYSMSMRSFVLVKGRLWVIARWLEAWGPVYPPFGVIYHPLLLRLFPLQRHLVILGTVIFVILWINGENLWRCAEKTDVALGRLVFKGCAYTYKGPLLNPNSIFFSKQ